MADPAAVVAVEYPEETLTLMEALEGLVCF